MNRVISNDGTSIAYWRQGAGPAVILVTGNLDDGSENDPLAGSLASAFTAYNYNRRGRGESGDTLPYALDREIEDIAALIAEAGGSAHVFGVSSGGGLALEAAAAGLPIDGLAVYDVPYSISDEANQRWQSYVRRLGPALADGRRGEAVELFMRLAGSSDEDIDGARNSPFWPDLETIAPTLAYDAACLADGYPPAARLDRIRQPTLVLTSGSSLPGMVPDFFEQSADAIAACIPHARRRTMDGLSHVPDPKVLVPELEQFFNAARG